MLTLRRRRTRETAASLAPPAAFAGSDAELLAEIEEVTVANRQRRDEGRERRLLGLRNLLGVRRVQGAGGADGAQGGAPTYPAPDESALPETEGVPEVAPAVLTPGLLRAAILRHGCLLVRGLVPRETAARFARDIDRCFIERERFDTAQRHDSELYEPFTPDTSVGDHIGRQWIKSGGGVLAVDSPRLSFEMFEMFSRAGLPALVSGYLGEPPLVTVHKTTLRKAEPSVAGAWHQDGAFMGDVRALNLWLSLSCCGDEAPGLDVVPRRLEDYVTTQTDEAWLDHMVSQRMAEEAAGETAILRPIFEPGDALLFDEVFLHKTGSDPSMPKPRFAIENWFFGAAGFPVDYAPLAI